MTTDSVDCEAPTFVSRNRQVHGEGNLTVPAQHATRSGENPNRSTYLLVSRMALLGIFLVDVLQDGQLASCAHAPVIEGLAVSLKLRCCLP